MGAAIAFLRRHLNDHVFFTGMGIMFVVIDSGGLGIEFVKQHILQDQWRSDWVKAHATAFALWVVLFLAQASLIATHRIAWHKKLGIGGMVLYFVMFALTLGAAIVETHNSPAQTALDFFMLHVVVHVDAIDFFLLAGIALWLHRSDSEAHKPLMFLATVALAIRFPLLGRITHLYQLPHYADQDLFVFAAFAYDWIMRGRIHRALLLGALVILIDPPLADYSFRIIVPQFMAHPVQ